MPFKHSDALEAALDKVRHDRIDLPCDNSYDGYLHRPDLSLWAGSSEGVGPHVVLMIGPMMGQQGRFVELTLDEGRLLVQRLLLMVGTVEDHARAVAKAAAIVAAVAADATEPEPAGHTDAFAGSCDCGAPPGSEHEAGCALVLARSGT